MHVSECLRSKKWSFGFTLTHYKNCTTFELERQYGLFKNNNNNTMR